MSDSSSPALFVGPVHAFKKAQSTAVLDALGVEYTAAANAKDRLALLKSTLETRHPELEVDPRYKGLCSKGGSQATAAGAASRGGVSARTKDAPRMTSADKAQREAADTPDLEPSA